MKYIQSKLFLRKKNNFPIKLPMSHRVNERFYLGKSSTLGYPPHFHPHPNLIRLSITISNVIHFSQLPNHCFVSTKFSKWMEY